MAGFEETVVVIGRIGGGVVAMDMGGIRPHCNGALVSGWGHVMCVV